MTDAQLEALALLVARGKEGAVSARSTSNGFIGSLVGRRLVEMGYARSSGGIDFYVTASGRDAYAAAMGTR